MIRICNRLHSKYSGSGNKKKYIPQVGVDTSDMQLVDVDSEG